MVIFGISDLFSHKAWQQRRCRIDAEAGILFVFLFDKIVFKLMTAKQIKNAGLYVLKTFLICSGARVLSILAQNLAFIMSYHLSRVYDNGMYVNAQKRKIA